MSYYPGTNESGGLEAIFGGTGNSVYVKGDILGADTTTTLARLAVGADGQVLTADSAQPLGIKWAALAGGGITTLNTLTAATQTFATGTTGTDFGISSSGSTHTFNIPDASATARGLVSTTAQTFAGTKTTTIWSATTQYNVGTDFFATQNKTLFNVRMGSDSGVSITTGSANVLIGFSSGNSIKAESNNTMIGDAVGVLVIGSNGNNTMIGASSGVTTTTGSYNTFIGSQGKSTAAGNSSILIGFGVSGTASNQLVIGGSDAAGGFINDAYIGSGITKVSPANITINATGGSGTNNTASNLILAGGKNTGSNRTGGNIIFQTGDATTAPSGTTPQTLVEVMRINTLRSALMGAARFQDSKGVNVASANNLALGNDGNCFLITGTTQINGIATVDWQAGSLITLMFSGILTVKHNTAAGGGFARIFLAGNTDLITTADTTLTLSYDGTQWQEIARKVTTSQTKGQATFVLGSDLATTAISSTSYVQIKEVIANFVDANGTTGNLYINIGYVNRAASVKVTNNGASVQYGETTGIAASGIATVALTGLPSTGVATLEVWVKKDSAGGTDPTYNQISLNITRT
jgi:hypothetical protein